MAAGVTGAVGVGVGVGVGVRTALETPEIGRTLVGPLTLTLETLVETETEPEHWAG